jgi:hypothetical protein
MRAAWCAIAVTAVTVPVAAQKPIEIDRTVQRVYGTAIMSSDIRQARLLRLLEPAPASDEAALTAIENRLLMLHEAARGAVTDPSVDQIAARRRTWQASWPAGTDLAALQQRVGMSDRALDGWFRDDLRIQTYLDQRFSRTDARRDERIALWIRELRTRANLTGGDPESSDSRGPDL